MSDSYVVQPITDSAAAAELKRRGYRPMGAGDLIDPATLPMQTVLVLMQVGAEHLARLGGAQIGDVISAGAVNRGLVEFLQGRDRWGTGYAAGRTHERPE